MVSAKPCRVLMIYPRFVADSFWNYSEVCELVGARYPAAPLGLITVAAMLPQTWEFRLINRNTEELVDDDILWADLVMTGGMQNQQPDVLSLIGRCKALGKPVVIGGPDPTSSPHVYEAADFRVLGEAELVIDDFVKAWESGERSGTFTAPKYQADVTKTPIPRFDLLKLDHYLYIGLQFSRGCPFTCEFCDIIELYGRVPRTKTIAQMKAELQALYDTGYRGHVDFVDDNLIGNKKAVKQFLPQLKSWLEEHDYPFEFSTEASVNLSDDKELLAMMRQANFFLVFVGIESPDPETLTATKKKQNTRRDLAASIHRIYAAGLMVTAGFIVGFDTEKVSIADAMVDFIEEASIPVCMVGLLGAMPNTQLTRRLQREGRLHAGHDIMPVDAEGDHCVRGINFDTLRPMRDVLTDYKSILERVYSPEAFAGRIHRLMSMLDHSSGRDDWPDGDIRRSVGLVDAMHLIFERLPEAKEVFWKTFVKCGRINPRAWRYAVLLMAMYVHLGPYSRFVIDAINRRIEALDSETPVVPRQPEFQAAASH